MKKNYDAKFVRCPPQSHKVLAHSPHFCYMMMMIVKVCLEGKNSEKVGKNGLSEQQQRLNHTLGCFTAGKADFLFYFCKTGNKKIHKNDKISLN